MRTSLTTARACRVARRSKVNTANKALARTEDDPEGSALPRGPRAGSDRRRRQPERRPRGGRDLHGCRAARTISRRRPGPVEEYPGEDSLSVAASTGMRRGEILALRWRHVDLERAAREDRRGLEGPGAKKPERRNGGTVASSRCPTSRLQRSAISGSAEPPELAGSDCLIFCYIDGSRLGETWWAKAFATAMKKVKLEEGGEEKIGIDVRARGIKPHSFRHTVATLRRDAGEDPAKIRADWAGRTSARRTGTRTSTRTCCDR